MQHVPLYFHFEHVVFGRGFVADIRFLGRATCTREFGSTWMYGVNPGALAEEGETMQAAYANFRNALVAVFFDLAEEAGSFEAFRASARSFFEATDDESVQEWVEAREAVRAGQDPELDENLDLRRGNGRARFRLRGRRGASGRSRSRPQSLRSASAELAGSIGPQRRALHRTDPVEGSKAASRRSVAGMDPRPEDALHLPPLSRDQARTVSAAAGSPRKQSPRHPARRSAQAAPALRQGERGEGAHRETPPIALDNVPAVRLKYLAQPGTPAVGTRGSP